jgi:hypothetical protein
MWRISCGKGWRPLVHPIHGSGRQSRHSTWLARPGKGNLRWIAKESSHSALVGTSKKGTAFSSLAAVFHQGTPDAVVNGLQAAEKRRSPGIGVNLKGGGNKGHFAGSGLSKRFEARARELSALASILHTPLLIIDSFSASVQRNQPDRT